jgi:hypothetical protein
VVALARWSDLGFHRLHALRCTIPEKADQVANRKKKGSSGGRRPAFDPERYKQRHAVEKSKPQCCHSRGSSALSSVPSRSVFMRAA